MITFDVCYYCCCWAIGSGGGLFSKIGLSDACLRSGSFSVEDFLAIDYLDYFDISELESQSYISSSICYWKNLLLLSYYIFFNLYIEFLLNGVL